MVFFYISPFDEHLPFDEYLPINDNPVVNRVVVNDFSSDFELSKKEKYSSGVFLPPYLDKQTANTEKRKRSPDQDSDQSLDNLQIIKKIRRVEESNISVFHHPLLNSVSPENIENYLNPFNINFASDLINSELSRKVNTVFFDKKKKDFFIDSVGKIKQKYIPCSTKNDKDKEIAEYSVRLINSLYQDKKNTVLNGKKEVKKIIHNFYSRAHRNKANNRT